MSELIFANSKLKHVRNSPVRILHVYNGRIEEMSKFGPDQIVRFIPNKTINAITTIAPVDHAKAIARFTTANAPVLDSTERPRLRLQRSRH